MLRYRASLLGRAGVHRYLSAASTSRWFSAPSYSKVLVLGSGGLSIGQAGEFDYSGSQAIKALKEDRIQTVLINPNIATIQTGKDLADKVYFLPVTPEYIEYVIRREKPDGILLTFGGQTALNAGVSLHEQGILKENGVSVLGTPIETLITSEDRDKFANALKDISIPVAQSVAVSSVSEALESAKSIGYPVIIRSAFQLGGLGSGFAENEAELKQLATSSLSLSPQILVEKSMRGWKEVEYEVVRDAENNCITVCNMENFDPLGVHTGDSIVVAPSQTLSDDEYHMLRTAAIKIVRHMGVIGECNVQYALNPFSKEYCVIEMNARLSRSSALASKATGYPLAFVAAKIAIGNTLPKLKNAVAENTTAFFEPSLDYIVTKVPRWDLKKFSHVSREIGSSMKSVGESMAIGRTFEESLQKALRQVDPSFSGFHGMEFADLEQALRIPTDQRVFAVGKALTEKKYTVDQLHNITKIDKWFLQKLQNIVETQLELESSPMLSHELLQKAKRQGFSDRQIAKAVSKQELEIRALRKAAGIIPFVKRIDTMAGEYPTSTNYLYSTYNASTDDLAFNDRGILVLGSGVYRIGSSVEFDWCGVSCVRSLRKLGFKTVMVNYNPETVSTDYDEADRLYFEELSFERVMDIYEKESASGAVVSVGGQLPQNMALALQKHGANVLGTDPKNIDSAEDRHKFSSILDSIGVDQPRWKELTNFIEAKEFAKSVGYPCLIRPSYVLSGAAMNVAYSDRDLESFLAQAADVSPEHPVVITKFIDDAEEIDVDAVAHKGKVLVHAISEHIENAGVHSGDATLVLPSSNVTPEDRQRIKDITARVADAFAISGPFNMQIIRQRDGALKVIECNLRASRSFPFVSKVLDVNFIDVATRALVDRDVPEPRDLMAKDYAYRAVKVSQFSWTRLGGADPLLGVEMGSTGEVACFGENKHEAFLTAMQAVNNFRMPRAGQGVFVGYDDVTSGTKLVAVLQMLSRAGFKVFLSDFPGSSKILETADLAHDQNVTVVQPFTSDDRINASAVFKSNNIGLVVHLGKRRPKEVTDAGYLLRRLAVDLGVPLINNENVAVLFMEALERQGVPRDQVMDLSGFRGKSWGEYVQAK